MFLRILNLCLCVAAVGEPAFAGNADVEASNQALCVIITKQLRAPTLLPVCHHASKARSPLFQSNEGHPLLIMDAPPVAADSLRNLTDAKTIRILVIGGVHGDEPASVLAVLTWMKLLMDNKTTISAPIHWRMAPLANPDGFLASPPLRTNSNGVDINRNFATDDWHSRAHQHWRRSARSDPRRFPGASPASEPETRWLQEEIRNFDPVAIIAVHTPYGIVDYDGPSIFSPRRIGPLHLHRLGTFPGSLGKYASSERDIPVMTLELSTTPPHLSNLSLRRMWHDILLWINHNTKQSNFSRCKSPTNHTSCTASLNREAKEG